MRKFCNEGETPCPYLLFKRKPKCTRYNCRLAYSRLTIKGLGQLVKVELDSICKQTLGAICGDRIDFKAKHCSGADNPAQFAENCCADCSWYKNNVN